MTILLHHEPAIRLGCFLAVLLLMALWEWRRPRRSLTLSRLRRWPANLGMVIVDSLVLRWLLPVLAVGSALEAQNQGCGLFNQVGDTFLVRLYCLAAVAGSGHLRTACSVP